MSLKSAKWLATKNSDEVVIVDCRYDLAQPAQAVRDYRQGHIPGAHFADLESDLCAPKGRHGGRHPLPSAIQFSALLSRLGWVEGKQLIAYDSEGSGAAHFWWLARYFGIEDVSVLQGGFQEWLNLGLPVSTDPPEIKPSPSPNLVPEPSLVATRDFVLEHLNNRVLIDSRSYERYTGFHEPIDPIAGRIPGAYHFDYKEVYNLPGEYRSVETLERHFSEIDPETDFPIVYCGSGVSACSNVLALSLIGVPALLYAGSFSDWISYADSPIERGDQAHGI
ncbi:MAG: sulfurtransferase [Firmicutes bacterium]|jgi:thiosulfate/3-mercaptopyruvate sulfurtransferase|uniref:Sulfurtransferase n=1 Tax=Sulfobacillus benefaciens TaxID=453960 RepID=A0A2T2XBB4_9FIRM|nr:sulfurtransferase [Bacillota bacterium]MCL5012410.1 sulfurtransferase [Bacillota bacterium]PSR31794.1 MAG: sulfurtransferase [Sulfobacillus benefaciens]